MQSEKIHEYSKHIYHFTTVEKALLHILPNMRLKLGSILGVNDPKESNIAEFWSLFYNHDLFDRAEIKNAFKKHIERNCKLLCFTQSYTIRNSNILHSGFKHPTMWAHYARHNGICLAIDREAFLIENKIPLNGSNEYFSKKVTYKPIIKLPQFPICKSLTTIDLSINKYLRENKNKLFFQKHTHWSNEDEWRLVHIGKDEFCSIKDSLRGICLGNTFDNNLICNLKLLLPKNRMFIEKVEFKDGNLYSSPFPIHKI